MVTDAVAVNSGPSGAAFVAAFADLSTDQAEASLLLAADLGLLERQGSGTYRADNPLCRFLVTKNQLQKATVIRVLLESYEPFICFRQRLIATGVAIDAARQTKVMMSLSEHYTDIVASTISLGTYSQVLRTSGGGHYEVAASAEMNMLELLMNGSGTIASQEQYIQSLLGLDPIGLVDRDAVIVPLVDALGRAKTDDPRGAVVQAGNAVESYLVALATHLNISLQGTGINSKLDELKRSNIQSMPTKLTFMGKYLGHVRNGADHGTDSEISAQWTISLGTGIQYVHVACSFISASIARVQNNGSPFL